MDTIKSKKSKLFLLSLLKKTLIPTTLITLFFSNKANSTILENILQRNIKKGKIINIINILSDFSLIKTSYLQLKKNNLVIKKKFIYFFEKISKEIKQGTFNFQLFQNCIQST